MVLYFIAAPKSYTLDLQMTFSMVVYAQRISCLSYWVTLGLFTGSVALWVIFWRLESFFGRHIAHQNSKKMSWTYFVFSLSTLVMRAKGLSVFSFLTWSTLDDILTSFCSFTKSESEQLCYISSMQQFRSCIQCGCSSNQMPNWRIFRSGWASYGSLWLDSSIATPQINIAGVVFQDVHASVMSSVSFIWRDTLVIFSDKLYLLLYLCEYV